MSAAFNLVNFTMSGIQLKITMHQKNKKTGVPVVTSWSLVGFINH